MFGSFDPPHQGHVATALRAKKQFNLHAVLMLPIAQSPTKKKDAQPTPFNTKMEMCKIIAEPNKNWLIPSNLAQKFSSNPLICLRDVKRLIEEFSKDNNLFIVSGEDFNRRLNIAVRALRVSQSLTHIASQCIPVKSINKFDVRIDTACKVFLRVSTPDLPRSGQISSSSIREAIQLRGASITSNQPPPGISKKMIRYIQKHGLYSSKTPVKKCG